MPVHPRTKKNLSKLLAKGNIYNNINFTKPLDYLTIISLQINSEAIFTDSGGMQKEAYFCKKPCVTIRDETEWLETLENGCNRIVGYGAKKLKRNMSFELNSEAFQDFYGKGHASDNIIKILLENNV